MKVLVFAILTLIALKSAHGTCRILCYTPSIDYVDDGSSDRPFEPNSPNTLLSYIDNFCWSENSVEDDEEAEVTLLLSDPRTELLKDYKEEYLKLSDEFYHLSEQNTIVFKQVFKQVVYQLRLCQRDCSRMYDIWLKEYTENHREVSRVKCNQCSGGVTLFRVKEAISEMTEVNNYAVAMSRYALQSSFNDEDKKNVLQLLKSERKNNAYKTIDKYPLAPKASILGSPDNSTVSGQLTL